MPTEKEVRELYGACGRKWERLRAKLGEPIRFLSEVHHRDQATRDKHADQAVAELRDCVAPVFPDLLPSMPEPAPTQSPSYAIAFGYLKLVGDRCRAWLAEQQAAPEPAQTDEAQPGENDWILVSEAVAQLPFIKNLKALDRYARDNPDKLRLRPHPEHKKRRQANAADVLRLEIEHNNRQLDAMDSPAADDLPPVSEKGITALAERVAQVRARKGK